MFRDFTLDGRAASRTESVYVWPAALLILVAASVPVWMFEIPALGDYVNHVTRMYALAHLDQDPALAQFYMVRWAIIPNLVMDIVVPPLAKLIGVHTASRLFVTASYLVLVTGSIALYRAVWGRVELGPLAAGLFLYTLSTYMGLFNYLFGVGLALWGIAGWIVMRERAPWQRGLASLGIVLLLFISHLFALGLYGLTLLAFEGWRLWRSGGWREPRRALPDALAFGLPFLIVPPLLLMSPSSGFADAVLWVGTAKLMGFDFLFGGYADTVGYVTGIAVGLGIAWGLWSGALRVHPVGAITIALGLVVYAAMPLVLFGSWFADSRLPIGIAFVALGFVRWELATSAMRAAFLSVVVALSLLRSADAGVGLAKVDPLLEEVRQSLHRIEPGSTVLATYADETLHKSIFRATQFTDDRALSFGLHHAPVLALMERSSLVPIAFTHPGKQVLLLKPDYADLDGDFTYMPRIGYVADAVRQPGLRDNHYWADWPRRFGYVYVLFSEPGRANPVPEHLTLVQEGRYFQLYKVK
ncbi:hypothetical protein C1S70_00275 [Azospirillum argentinense]|uniref:Glycosyltransferase RgtA/B/C/D-like domain-containing protein n=1 Tax=Azospirillum argentinense TaxID=2970906 RepID=A0A2K1G709_9PROT|nr:hypothetical protein [Azospirillum argentinense]PNR00591.1 hypothetical protein C1S70_00275 [Azospirillum argentinense]